MLVSDAPRPHWSTLPRAGSAGVEVRVLLQTPSLVIANLRFALVATIDEHSAPFDIDVVCLAGRGFVAVGAEQSAFRSGQQVRWPRDTSHRLWTDGEAMETLMIEHRRPPGSATNVLRLGWMGAKTAQFDRMNEFYRDALGLDVVSIDDSSGRFRLQDGTEVHVYGPKDKHHEFFGVGPVVAFQVEDFAVAQGRLLAAGVEFIYPEPQRASGKVWQHFRAPDGNVYELIGDEAAPRPADRASERD